LYCKNKLKGFKEKPQDIPTEPRHYKDEWKGFGDWLGTGMVSNKNRIYKSFKEARAYIQKINLKSSTQWSLYCQNKLKEFKEKPQDIPNAVHRVYKDEWKGWGDWLGTGRKNLFTGTWRPFKEARAYVQKLNLKNVDQWRLYCKNKLKGFKERPQDIPATPSQTYKEEWKGFSDWLGNKK